ncbi:MAG TPA: tannase/feruloyl esterase family alpha/beta hydrolase [Stellaceae bacterium]
MKTKRIYAWTAALSLASLALPAAAAAAATCGNLASLALPNTTLTAAQLVNAGSFTAANGQTFTLPAFCRVAGYSTPSSDSDIQFEVWIPYSTWNGKLEVVGGGGFAGTISFSAMATALNRGYATASTDTGHQNPSSSDGSWALGHPEKVIDFGYRAIHLTTVNAKAIVTAYAGAPKYDYFNGCSTGGRQALKEAQMFPDDFDGIIAGDPANYWVELNFGQLWPYLVNHPDSSATPVLPTSQYTLINDAVLKQCAGHDGGVSSDLFISDPPTCNFNPRELQCKRNQDPTTCLSAAQVRVVDQIYAGAQNPVTYQPIFPGFARGSETDWAGEANSLFAIAVSYMQYWVFDDPSFNVQTSLNFGRDVALARHLDGGVTEATDPDLRPFLSHGKLIQYHGWADGTIAPGESPQYYQSVAARLYPHSNPSDAIRETQKSYRLFMVPGMYHCSGGPGANTFDTLTALDNWVEQGTAPDQIVATHYNNNVQSQGVAFTRPLCPYPQVPKYSGVGATTNAASFVCANPNDHGGRGR